MLRSDRPLTLRVTLRLNDRGGAERLRERLCIERLCKSTNQPVEALHLCCIVHLFMLAVSLRHVKKMCVKHAVCWEGSDLFQGLLDEGAVSPLGQDDGLHVFPVQAAALGSVQG